jgi:uncharacterized protein (TIGR04141 family)
MVLADPVERPNPRNYRIVYAIATEKALPQGLPFFSKVTLKNSLKTLRALDFQVAIARISIHPDIYLKKKIKPH